MDDHKCKWQSRIGLYIMVFFILLECCGLKNRTRRIEQSLTRIEQKLGTYQPEK